ncbi:hypothetical protein DFH08DRAFT_828525 [Mycena albidolilacea]|uniref:HAT C-terminal dimerisation domain-containing protein n=1 Tax=Mycena albidolilacea TaxID=1033008 RepID=A0AAD6YWF7_9AGAR|nr:hypothetical protein DFH08DRAFT_828525 [Mycena albidolilacea]
MATSLNPLWAFFQKSDIMFNKSHWTTHCEGCVRHHQNCLKEGRLDNVGVATAFINEKEERAAARELAGAIRGEKGVFITHILGSRTTSACPHASKAGPNRGKGPARRGSSSQSSSSFEKRARSPSTADLLSQGPQILPSAKVIGGRLLNEGSESVEAKLATVLKGKNIGVLYGDGWKALNKDSVNGVCANVDYKSYTIELVEGNGARQSGPGMCQTFIEIIDRIETKRVGFSWEKAQMADPTILLGPPDQFQLILGDYFKVHKFAAGTAELATTLIGWINNHGKVRKIFDRAQRDFHMDRLGRVLILAYLVANLTRLDYALHRIHAVIPSGGTAAVGRDAEPWWETAKGAEKTAFTEEAEKFCTLIMETTFWSSLESLIEDIEPICYGTNLNQKDSTRADQSPRVASGMTARLEKRWKDCDQPLFLLALILNPFERLSAFGPEADLNHFNCLDLLISGRDPIAVWVAFRTPAVAELTDFAITLLKIVVNQAGCERVFSDLKVKQTQRRNRLKLEKLGKMTKIGAEIRADQIERGVIKLRTKRVVHKSTDALLAVPRYLDLLQDQDDEETTERGRALVSTASGWRTVMAKWVGDARAAEIDAAEDSSDSEDEEVPVRIRAFWGIDKEACSASLAKEIEAEAELMMALAEAERQADEDEDAQPDDGAVEIPSEEELGKPLELQETSLKALRANTACVMSRGRISAAVIKEQRNGTHLERRVWVMLTQWNDAKPEFGVHKPLRRKWTSWWKFDPLVQGNAVRELENGITNEVTTIILLLLMPKRPHRHLLAPHELMVQRIVAPERRLSAQLTHDRGDFVDELE